MLRKFGARRRAEHSAVAPKLRSAGVSCVAIRFNATVNVGLFHPHRRSDHDSTSEYARRPRRILDQHEPPRATHCATQPPRGRRHCRRTAHADVELESTLADGTQADAVALRGKLRKQLDNARARLSDTREAVRERANVALADADDYVHENPWQTLAIVGGVALIVGALFASRVR